jgi:glycosyltransferase involved in cell wall biosynthesis
LQVVKGLGLGGTEKVMQLLAEHLPPALFEVAVHSPEDGPRAVQLRKNGIPTYVGMELDLALRSFRPHVVHLHRAGWPEPGLMRPLRAAAPCAIVETNVFGRYDSSSSGQLIDTHLFVSHFCAERFTRITGIPAEPPRYEVMYNPVDTDFFEALCPGSAEVSGPVLGRISRADPGKWSPLALDILPILARSVPGFRCKIIGGVPAAEAFVRDYGLGAQVDFLPPVSTDEELAEFYGGLSVLAHANQAGESFGLVIAEAMACGLPVVTHPAEGFRDNAQLELVENGVTGFVATTAEEFAEAVRWLFEHPEEARRMGQAGREKSKRLFRVQDIAARVGQLYHRLLASKGIM